MRVPARYRAKYQTSTQAVASRDITNPIKLLEADRLFTAAALTPGFGRGGWGIGHAASLKQQTGLVKRPGAITAGNY